MLPLWVPTLQIGQSVPRDVRLTDQSGAVRNWTSFRGDTLVVGFIYTRCEDSSECPAISAKFAEMQKQLLPHTHLIELTLDPSHDTPIVLRHYGQSFNQDPHKWTMLTGNPQSVLMLTRRFGISVRDRSSGGIEHTEAIAVLDREERLRSLTAGTSWQPREVLAEARALNDQPSDLLARAVLLFRNVGTTCGALLSSIDAPRQMISLGCAIATLALIISMSVALLRNFKL